MKKRFKFFSMLVVFTLIMVSSMSVFAAELGNVDVGIQEDASEAYHDLMNLFPQSRSTGDRMYPDYYGGSYINDEGQLVVYITDLNNAPLAMIAKTGDSVIYQECEYSYNELNNVMDTLNEYKFTKPDSAIANNFNSYALLDKENRIEVRLDEFSEESIQKFKDVVFDSDIIIFTEAKKSIEEYEDVNPGGQIASDYSYGSMGYRVIKDGKVGIVTAGHVISTNENLFLGTGTTVIGKCITSFSSNGSYDAAFCEITNSIYTPTNTLSGTTNTLSTAISEPGVGTMVNKIGYKSGHTNRYIRSTNSTITTSSGVTRTDMVEVECYATNGDSGGIFYSFVSSSNTRYTLGVLSAGDGTYTYYSKANTINVNLGVSRY